ncbi:MAG TPA: hypothetical protein VHQ86_02715 [Candidatus Saccharimonadia bacterium]|nr:hypothetical protein [Candidatus Saccharimonadia bacterium]
MKPVVFGVASVAVVALIVGGVFWMMNQKQKPTIAQATAKAVDLDSKGKYAEAEAVLLEAQPRAKTTADKATILSRLAMTMEGRGDLNKALQYLRDYEKLVPNDYGNTAAIGELAEQMGDKALAIQEYNKAADLLDAMPTNGNSDVKVSNADEAASLRLRAKNVQ